MEILVVIAVVGVLTGITLVALPRVRESANSAKCQGNLRQIVSSAMLYANDHGGNYLPPIANPSSGYQQWMFNHDFMDLVGYTTNGTDTSTLPDYFRCPTAQSQGSTLNINYGCNITGIGISASNYKTAGYTPRLKLLASPAQLIYFMDALDWWVQFSKADQYVGTEAPMTQVAAYRHHGGANVAFFDGHVAWMPRAELIRSVNRWNVYSN